MGAGPVRAVLTDACTIVLYAGAVVLDDGAAVLYPCTVVLYDRTVVLYACTAVLYDGAAVLYDRTVVLHDGPAVLYPSTAVGDDGAVIVATRAAILPQGHRIGTDSVLERPPAATSCLLRDAGGGPRHVTELLSPSFPDPWTTRGASIANNGP